VVAISEVIVGVDVALAVLGLLFDEDEDEVLESDDELLLVGDVELLLELLFAPTGGTVVDALTVIGTLTVVFDPP
jgi:hypothetical protein